MKYMTKFGILEEAKSVVGVPGIGFKLTREGDYDMQRRKLRRVGEAEDESDGVTKKQTLTLDSDSFDAKNKRVKNLGQPVDSSDTATKKYVDDNNATTKSYVDNLTKIDPSPTNSLSRRDDGLFASAAASESGIRLTLLYGDKEVSHSGSIAVETIPKFTLLPLLTFPIFHGSYHFASFNGSIVYMCCATTNSEFGIEYDICFNKMKKFSFIRPRNSQFYSQAMNIPFVNETMISVSIGKNYPSRQDRVSAPPDISSGCFHWVYLIIEKRQDE